MSRSISIFPPHVMCIEKRKKKKEKRKKKKTIETGYNIDFHLIYPP
jgi:hypothetical protein